MEYCGVIDDVNRVYCDLSKGLCPRMKVTDFVQSCLTAYRDLWYYLDS